MSTKSDPVSMILSWMSIGRVLSLLGVVLSLSLLQHTPWVLALVILFVLLSVGTTLIMVVFKKNFFPEETTSNKK